MSNTTRERSLDNDLEKNKNSMIRLSITGEIKNALNSLPDDVKKINLSNFIKILIPLALICSSFYEYIFFRQFGIDYFVYFDLSDPIRFFYKLVAKSQIFIIEELIVIPIAYIFKYLIIKKINMSAVSKKKIIFSLLLVLTFSVLITNLIGYILNLFLIFSPYLLFLLLGSIVIGIAILFFIGKCKTRILWFIIFIVILIFLAIIKLAKEEACRIGKYPKRITIKTEGSSKNKLVDAEESCTFLIDNTLKYFFIKNTCTGKVHVYPTLDNIMEIHFEPNKHDSINNSIKNDKECTKKEFYKDLY